MQDGFIGIFFMNSNAKMTTINKGASAT